MMKSRKGSKEVMEKKAISNSLERTADPHSFQATGVNTNGIARSVGVTAPIYPMRGNVVTGIICSCFICYD